MHVCQWHQIQVKYKNRIKPVKPLKHTWKCVGLLKTVTTVIHTACRLCFLLCSRHKRQLNIKIKWYWWNYRNKDKMWQTKINFIWFINLFHKNHTAFGLKIPNPPIGGCGLDTDDTITSRLQRILWHIWASPLFSTDRRICLSQLTSVSHTACRLVKKHLSPRGHIITLYVIYRPNTLITHYSIGQYVHVDLDFLKNLSIHVMSGSAPPHTSPLVIHRVDFS